MEENFGAKIALLQDELAELNLLNERLARSDAKQTDLLM